LVSFTVTLSARVTEKNASSTFLTSAIRPPDVTILGRDDLVPFFQVLKHLFVLLRLLLLRADDDEVHDRDQKDKGQ